MPEQMKPLVLHVNLTAEQHAQLQELANQTHHTPAGKASDMAEKWLQRELIKLVKTSRNGHRKGAHQGTEPSIDEAL